MGGYGPAMGTLLVAVLMLIAPSPAPPGVTVSVTVTDGVGWVGDVPTYFGKSGGVTVSVLDGYQVVSARL